MTLNPQFQQIGESFVKQYYLIFDGEREGREKLANFYHAELSLMSFEGVQVQGAAQIIDKIKGLTFNKIARAITTVDCQPTFDGGVMVNILGQLKMDEDPVHGFSQTFVLKPMNDSFFIQHDSFRLVIHNQ
ncbi:probable nuclear transport factor 2 [Penaeus japonicus]|uniref:probable nuclear transport factor 2 n=1 Tax=Penaeus japonicus TaxID=27405 RepID=UPI001C715EA8|nr:probable nuclear transport factor 2 [Penaeus japonicus]